MNLRSKGEQLADIIRLKIRQGIYSVNSRIPTQRELSQMYSVSRATVLAAVNILKAEGVLSGERGSGMKVIAGTDIEIPETIVALPNIHVIMEYTFFYNHLFVNLFEALLMRYGNLLKVDINFTHGLESFSRNMNREDIYLLCGKFSREKLEDFRSVYPRCMLVHWERPGFNYVAPDEKKAGRLAGKTLIECGHTSIGVIHCMNMSEALYQNQEFVYRIYGFRDYLAENDISPAIEFKNSTWDWRDSAKKIINVFLRQSVKVTAILCPFDQIAANVYQALQEEDIRIPEDISIISFDNYYYTQFFKPGLTCVTSPFSQYAELLYNGIQEITRGNEFCRNVVPYVINRNSIANLNEIQQK